MTTKVVLNNVLVKSSSSKAGKPKGSKFVLGKGLKVVLPSSEADKLLDLQNLAIETVSEQFNVPKNRIKANELVKLDTNDNVDYMFINLTKVPQEKGTDTYLTNEDGSYVEEICNFLPNEETGKFERRMPIIVFQGAETQYLPFAESLIDIELLVRTSYDKEKLMVKLYLSVEKIIVVKPAEGQTGGAKKESSIVDINLDLPVGTTEKKTTTKKATKKVEVVEDEVSDEAMTDIF